MYYIANKPVIEIDYQKLKEAEITIEELENYITRYILYPSVLNYGIFTRFINLIIQCLIQAGIWIFLNPRKTKLGSLNQKEVDQVYDREAKNYNRKHHFTTRGQDLTWRRQAAQLVSVIAKSKNEEIKVLDICTGTGLTIKEIEIELRKSGFNANIIGLDYNENMLSVARRTTGSISESIRFIQWDATELVEKFPLDSIDVITQVFGIGGVPEPLSVFSGVLEILKPGGKFIMIDMHKPIPELPGELPLLFWWLRTPVLEMITYEETTIPLALNRLWGWRDTTALFYLLPLICFRTPEDGKYWGFKIESFEHQSERWWLSLPVMPTAKIIVQKSEITYEEFRKRKAILDACNII